MSKFYNKLYIFNLLLLSGVILLILGFYLFIALNIEYNKAKKYDFFTINESLAPKPCQNPLKAVEIDRRVISINESEAIKIILKNDFDSECGIPVSIYTQDFNITPMENIIEIKLLPQSEGEILWIISPKKIGMFKIGIQAGLSSSIIGISVTTIMGFPAIIAEILSKVFSFFGVALTLPWIIRYHKEIISLLKSFLNLFKSKRKSKRKSNLKRKRIKK